MEMLELDVFYWSKDTVKYENIISQLLLEGWKRKQPDIPYQDDKGRIYKWEVNLIRSVE